MSGATPLALLLQAAHAAQAPNGAFPSLAHILGGGPLKGLATALGALGDLLWVVAYVLIVRASFKARTYGVPLLAVCLNFTWEFWLAVVAPPHDSAAHVAHVVWLAVDSIIVWQLFRYGRDEQRIPVVRRYFVPIVIVTMLCALVGQVTLRAFLVGDQIFPDIEAIGIAYFDNLVMAGLFVMMYFERPAQRGLSLAAAWAMTIGTAVISIANVIVFNTGTEVNYEIQFRRIGGGPWMQQERGSEMISLNFFYFMFAGIVVLNAIYLVLLHRARQGRPLQGADAVAPGPA